MRLKDFYYELPEERIAQYPLRRREHARLLIIDRRQKSISHSTFSKIGQYLPEESQLVLNNSKVIPARLLGQKETTGARIEIFLLRPLGDGNSYGVLMRPLRRLQVGDNIIFNGHGLKATVIDTDKPKVTFNIKDIVKKLDQLGHMPLPPYIKRSDTPQDRKYYQTVYAQKSGSVASPTAGLHFTKRILKSLVTKGHQLSTVTLHINYATFKPVEEEDITKHKMHVEQYSVTQKTYQALQKAKAKGKKIIAVGTTSCRVLETVAATGRREGDTDLFITPGYDFRMTDALITNFHQPHSTLLMLVCALGGYDLVMKAYHEAIKKKYRFFSYGDAMLIV